MCEGEGETVNMRESKMIGIQPMVSVMLCSYNGAEYIKDTIESILKQTYTNFELIIVDDASTDNTPQTIQAFSDERIRLILLEENQNICNAGNIAFREARGKYGALIGHDDLWREDKLEKQIVYLEEHEECGVCFTWADIVNEKLERVNEKYKDLAERFHATDCTSEEWVQKLLLRGNYFCTPSAMVRMKVLGETDGYRYSLLQLQDYDLWLRMLANTSFHIIEENLTLYRRFDEVQKNLSSENKDTFKRRMNEQHYSVDHFIGELSVSQFCELFRAQMCNPTALSEKEILCEKALLRIRYGNGMGRYRLMELLEDNECRKILHDMYGVTLTEFYKNNIPELFVSPELQKRLEEQEILINQYRELVQKLSS